MPKFPYRFSLATLLLLVTIACLYAALWSSWAQLQDTKNRLLSAEARIETLRGEITALEEETEALRSEPLAIEAAIREDLHLARPGETVVRLLSDTSPRFP